MPLHPQIRVILDEAAAAEPAEQEREAELLRAEHEQRTAAIAGPVEEVAAVRDVTIPSDDGPIPARRYIPEDCEGGTLVWLHGGGWVIGSLESFDHVCRGLANAARAEVLSVAYRLAPEHPWPAAVRDADAALRWAAATLPGSLAVGGDSAGGNLTAIAVRRARDAGGPEVCAQLLVYPVCDSSMDTGSYEEFAAGYYLTREDMAWFFAQYVGEDADPLDPDISPLRATDLAGLPPATVVLAGADPLVDEGGGYAQRLADAGVDVDVRVFDDMIHGFLRWTGRVDAARVAIEVLGTAARAALGRVAPA